MREHSEIEKIIDEVDKLEIHHDNIRKLFPFLDQDYRGEQKITGAVINFTNPFFFQYQFIKKLQEGDIKELNDIAHYLNQNVLIRLFAILQEYKIVKYNSPIDASVPGGKEVNILKKLRNVLGHESGKYLSDCKKHRAVAKLMIEELGINFDIEGATEFDLSKDKVIKPLIVGARKYIKNCP